MAIIKCKMCGGDMTLNEDKTLGMCEYCGSTMTLPKVSDEQRAARFNRGNHFRRQGEFDKALAVYESIVREDDGDAEAHWCCALCRFGIEYVEDPNTFEYLPTCHRASFDNFLEDVDYKAALENSDGITRRQYQKEAAKIAEVQRGILATSQNEEPFDVFICYKETDDETKERTRDSLDAQEIYFQLTQEGYRVFFSRITLEDKAGTEYEPYIFAALNSAKVMVAIGSKPEYFNAVWVKNEWSRFLAMMRKDRGKLLLPCYKGMDPYDLPEQLGVLQSYDMAKIGFMQDLVRGIKKVIAMDDANHTEVTKESVIVNSSGLNVAPLVRRAFMYLEDGEWERADEYCEKVLDQEPENAEAYLGKLMAEQQVHRKEDLKDCAQPYDESSNFKKAVRYGSEALALSLKEYVSFINDRNETARKTDIYNNAFNTMKMAKTEDAFQSAANSFQLIPSFRDADDLVKLCLEEAEKCRRIAEETRRIEEERRRIAEERVKRRATAIALALQEGCEAKKEPTVERKIAETKERIQFLAVLRNSFDALLTQASQLQQEQAAVANQEAKLSEQRAKLGLFSGKEKKRIDESLFALTARKHEFANRIVENTQQRCGFSSKADIEREIAMENAVLSDLQTQIKRNHSNIDNVFGFEEALRIYLREPEVTSVVNSMLYPTVSTNSIVFGQYIQKENGSPEPLEWQILDKSGGRLLLISKYGLDSQRYNASFTDVTWEYCTLRKWLNGPFYDTAFNSTCKKMIVEASVSADVNPSFNTSAGNKTIDKVFLLSLSEVNKYFCSDSLRECRGTGFCFAQGAQEATNGNCCWWLRSPGESSRTAANVRSDGSIHIYGDCVYDGNVVVRPAVWIDIES